MNELQQLATHLGLAAGAGSTGLMGKTSDHLRQAVAASTFWRSPGIGLLTVLHREGVSITHTQPIGPDLGALLEQAGQQLATDAANLALGLS